MTKECPVDVTDFTVSFDCECQRCKSRLFGLLGFSGIAVILFGIIASAMTYPGYNLSNQFMSDLGMVTINPSAGVLNGSFIVGGVLLAMFSVFYLTVPARRAFTFGSMFFGLMLGISIAATGFHPYDTETETHTVTAMFVFAGMLGSSLSFPIALFYQHHDNIPKTFAIIGLAAFIMLVVMSILAASGGVIPDITSRPSTYHVANIEWISVIIYLGWIFSLGIYELY